MRIQLPDSLTTWSLQSTVASAATQVGDGTGSLVVTKDLLVRPELPRFLRNGDHLTLRAVVNNTTARALQVAVMLDGSGVTPALHSKREQVVTVVANGEMPVGWPVAVTGLAGGTGGVTITVRAINGVVEPDAVAQSLPIEAASYGEVVARAGATAASATETLRLPGDLDRSQGTLQVNLTPSLASGIGPALTYLRSYPYWCAEQTTSHLFPEMVLRRLLPELPAAKNADPADLRYALHLLVGLQQSDGGWGWWYENTSSPFMTAYAMDGLLAAQRAGFKVDTSVLARGTSRLQAWQSTGQEPDAGASNLNVEAYIGYVLAMAGARWDSGGSLYAQRDMLAPYGMAYLALALQREGGKAEQISTLVRTLKEKAVVDVQGMIWWPQNTYDDAALESPVRSTAVVVDALARLTPRDVLVPGGVRWLVNQRQDNIWQSTQDTAISLVALGDYLAHSGELHQTFGYAVEVNGHVVGTGRLTPVDVANGRTVTVPLHGLLHTGGNALRITRQPGASSGSWLYYGYSLQYYRSTKFVPAQANGVAISRRYVVLRDGKQLSQASQQTVYAHAGDVLRVELTMTVTAGVSIGEYGDTSSLNYVMVEDPLPSGAEPLDASLLTSSLATQLRNQSKLPATRSYGNGEEFMPAWWGTWYPDHVEMRDDRVALFASYLSVGTYHYSYLAQITAPGVYRALPASVEAMYHPEVHGHSAGQELIVR